jgi:putative intracellular protease/amidase
MKKVLIVETNTQKYAGTNKATGLWLGESTEFVDELYKHNIEVDFISPLGGFVPLDPRSMKYTDKGIMKIYLEKNFVRDDLINTKKPADVNPVDYHAIYFTGGHGVMGDFPDNKEIQKIALKIYENNGYLLSVCHGVVGLLNIKDREGNFLISGKRIT